MPTAPARPCTNATCHALQPCALHPRSTKPFANAQRTGHNWYGSVVWKRERAQQLAIHPYCHVCLREDRLVAATTVDHEPPHRGDYRAFLDRTRYRSMCSHHHNAKTGRETAARR